MQLKHKELKKSKSRGGKKTKEEPTIEQDFHLSEYLKEINRRLLKESNESWFVWLATDIPNSFNREIFLPQAFLIK